MSEPLVVETIGTSGAGGGAVQMWTLQRPHVRNALNPQLVEGLRRELSRAKGNDVRVVVLAGAGAGFSAGADLSHLLDCANSGRSPLPHLRNICDLTLAIEASPIVFIAALHGFAVAGGLEIALACDLVVAASGTLIGDGHVKNNLVPGGGGSVRMPPKLGAAASSWLALSGELLSAEQLLATGWLHAVVELDEVLPTAYAMASTLAQRPAAAQRRYKAGIVAEASTTAAALERELEVFDEHWKSADVADHLARFLSAPRVDRAAAETVR